MSYHNLRSAARWLSTSPTVLAKWIARGFLGAVRHKKSDNVLISTRELRRFAMSRRRLERSVHISCTFSPMRATPDAKRRQKEVA